MNINDRRGLIIEIQDAAFKIFEENLDDECNKLAVAIMKDSTELAQKIEKVKYAQRSRSNGLSSKESSNRYRKGEPKKTRAPLQAASYAL
jgi:hypothetical protein